MNKKTIGSSGLQVSPLGFGGWAIGGPFLLDGLPDGWGEVDDKESIRAVQTALDQGINFFDTADVYGTGHSEEILGQALQGRRQDAVIATKFGFTYDAATRNVFTKLDMSRNYIRWACLASLKLSVRITSICIKSTRGISRQNNSMRRSMGWNG